MKKSLESAVDISFRLFFLCCPLTYFFHLFLLSYLTDPLLSSSFIYQYIFLLLSVQPVSIPPSSSPLLSFPVSTSLQLPFVPVCQKSASITGCCCITVAIMQICLLFNVSKNAFFVRVRTNLHGVTCTRKGRHTSRYIFNSLTIFAYVWHFYKIKFWFLSSHRMWIYSAMKALTFYWFAQNGPAHKRWYKKRGFLNPRVIKF